MNTPINDAVKEHLSHISYHTPSNDGSGMGLLTDNYDVTELSYTDNIIYRRGIIAESEAEVAKVFGSDNVLFSTAGSTTLINIAMHALSDDEPFLVYENAHGSVFNSMRMMGVKAYVSRGMDIIEAIKETGAKRVVVTSPNYFGKMVPADTFDRIKNETDAKVMWDCAHGSHFRFSNLFPKWDPSCADIVIHSLHKTAPTMTSGAIMHVSNRYIERAKTWFSMIHTTSPSYPILMSIETGVKFLLENGQKVYEKAVADVKAFEDSMKNTAFHVYTNDDPTRVSIESAFEGSLVSSYLEQKGIYPEMTYGNRVVLIVNAFNSDKLSLVAKYLSELELDMLSEDYQNEVKKKKIRRSGLKAGKDFVGIKELTFYRNFDKVELDDAVGRIAYKEVGLYPPGVPDIYSGDLISAEDLSYLKEHMDSIFGLLDGKMLVAAE
jgi:lysine decarboxylase